MAKALSIYFLLKKVFLIKRVEMLLLRKYLHTITFKGNLDIITFKKEISTFKANFFENCYIW